MYKLFSSQYSIFMSIYKSMWMCVCAQFPKSLNMSNCRREHKGLAHKKPLFIENDILRFEPLMSHACLVYLLEGANIDDFFLCELSPNL